MPDGFAIPLQLNGGLPYMKLHLPTDEELDTLSHVVLMSDMDWDPSVFDSVLSMEEFFDVTEEQPSYHDYGDDLFTE